MPHDFVIINKSDLTIFETFCIIIQDSSDLLQKENNKSDFKHIDLSKHINYYGINTFEIIISMSRFNTIIFF